MDPITAPSTTPITAQGMTMPKLGLGTWRMKGAECTEAVQRALGLGYRHIDTAEMYGNEEAVGEALAHAGVPRDQVHVTSKVWYEHLAPDAMDRAIDATLARLGTSYVDLYLIHWPAPGMDMAVAIGALRAVQESGRARAIGVSNFTVALLNEACALAPIACNQVEYHVLLDQTPLLAQGRAGRLCSAGPGPPGRARGACCHRPQTFGHPGASGAQMAAGPGQRLRDPKSRAPGDPGGEPRRNAHHAGRHRPGGHCNAAQGAALRAAGLGTTLGLEHLQLGFF